MKPVYYSHERGVTKQRHIFRWFFLILSLFALFPLLWFFDYTSMIDVPLIDEEYDRKNSTIRNR